MKSTRHGCWLPLLVAVLVGCTQPATAVLAGEEKEPPPTSEEMPPQGGEAAAQEAVELVDRIAESLATPGAAAPPPPAPEAPLPPGPAMASSEWIARVLRMIDGLKTPRDTQPAQVSRALNLPLARKGGEWVVDGPLTNGGTYFVWVNDLYGERPDKWTAGLSQWLPEGRSECLFPLDVLRRHVAAQGYRATEGVRRRDGEERALYRSVPTADGIVFVVSAHVIYPQGSEQCIRAIRVNANTPEDEG